MFAAPAAELTEGAAAHGWPDRNWTLVRIRTLVERRFGTNISPAGIRRLLHRHGRSHQIPGRQVVEQDPRTIGGG
ncbi:helix-turn-helix domain-containing protein [Nocardia brevicatena]|uniref:helix-turn-helix domain-containing protein n=1 Tax=Nocardia brevicatena TaxID=37327 RepID=UPI001C3F166F|nr:winged helix-turn-helix domain-containing protein [Nocardia brevicatena]